MTQKTIILKFGGASVNTPKSFHFVADIIAQRKSEYQNIVIVISAMGNTTDELIALAKHVNPNPPRRELDMLISAGERQSIALLSMALALKNIEAVSFTGSQAGIITTNDHFEAKILDLRPKRIVHNLQKGKVVIVAGFQGMSTEGDITTLGRGGSDTTAVALAVALAAEKVEFFKDVLGVYDKDPNLYKNAKLLPKLTYSDAQTIVKNGAQVLHHRCVILAEKNNIPLHIVSFKTALSKNHPKIDINGTSIQNNASSPHQSAVYEEA